MRLKITLFLVLSSIYFHQLYAQCSDADFEERNGIAILEMESKIAGSWKNESISGASANSALTYRGGDSFNSPGASLITYMVKINSPGTYRFIWRNKISIIASHSPTSEHNDSWLKINGSDFYGKNGSDKVFPGGSGKSPIAEGATSGGYFKVYTNAIDWNWRTYTSDNVGHAIYADFSKAGVYAISVSGRSAGHTLDRMVLYKESSYSASQAQNLGMSQTNCSGGGTTPTPPTPPTPDNKAPSVSFNNLTNGQEFAIGSSVSVGLSASDADGSIAKHQIYVNGSLVDTDGVDYSPYQLTNITAGSYAIKATVTDNRGTSTSATVNISAGGSTPNPPTPPTPPTTGNNPPVVSFTNISDGQDFTVGSSFSVGLSASDSDGSIVKHQIFVNGTLVDTDGSSYTAYPITNIKAGSYAIKATVTDNSGTSTSATVNISAGSSIPVPPTPPTPPTTGNNPPIVSFANISDGQNFAVGSTISVGLSASDSDGSISKYQIYVNGTLVDTDGASFTPYELISAKAGAYVIKGTVTDNVGASTSITANISVGGSTPQPPSNGNTVPTVKFTNLSEGQVVTAGSTVYVGVSASDTDGSVVKYQIYVNGSLMDTDEIYYTSHPIVGIKSVNHTIKAVVTDNKGATAFALVNIVASSGSKTAKAASFSVGKSSGNVLDTNLDSSGLNESTLGNIVASPNPVESDGKVSLLFPKGTSGEFGYSVFSLAGVQLEQGKFLLDSSNNKVDLELYNIGRQGQGVYYLTLSSSDLKETIAIIRK